MGRRGLALFLGVSISAVSIPAVAGALASASKSLSGKSGSDSCANQQRATKTSADTSTASEAKLDKDDDDEAADESTDSIAKIVLPPGRQAMLDANNALRTELGLPTLVWSRHLAHAARLWAKHLAVDVHSLVHSNTGGMGENLAMASTGDKTSAGLADLWATEKAYFLHATFPDVSKTGDWRAVGHYSQIIWRDTTKVGCGIATDDKNDYLVCEYAPQGNIYSEPVY